MEDKLSNKERIIISSIIFVLSCFIYYGIMEQGRAMIEIGREMSMLQSKAGTSLAEHYYRLHGETYVCFGFIVRSCADLIWAVGTGISVWISYPMIIKYKRKKKKEVKTDLKMMGEQTRLEKNIAVREQEVVEKGNHIFCTQCGNKLSAESVVCSKCGYDCNSSIKKHS